MTSDNSRTRLLLTAAGLSALLATPLLIGAADKEPPSGEELAIETANTPAEFQKLAAYFRGEAAEARAMAARHRRMRNSFMSRSAGAESAMRQHCEHLIAAYQQAASEYDAMAIEYEMKAKPATK